MTELQILRWFDNLEPPESYEDETPRCRWCKEVEGECNCKNDWKLED